MGLRESVFVSRPETLSAAIESAHEAERMFSSLSGDRRDMGREVQHLGKEVARLFSMQRTSQSKRAPNRRQAQDSFAGEEVQQTRTVKRRTPPRCLRCDEKGHTFYDCQNNSKFTFYNCCRYWRKHRSNCPQDNTDVRRGDNHNKADIETCSLSLARSAEDADAASGDAHLMGGTRVYRQTENTNTKLNKHCMQEHSKSEEKGETRTHKLKPMQKENLMLIKKLMRDVEPLLMANRGLLHLRSDLHKYIDERFFAKKSGLGKRSCKESFELESACADGSGQQNEFLQGGPNQVVVYQPEILYQEAVQLHGEDDICNNLDLPVVTVEDDDDNYPGGEVSNMDHASSYDALFGTDDAEFADNICLLWLHPDEVHTVDSSSGLKTGVVDSCTISDASGSWKWFDGVRSVRLRLNNPPDTGIGLKYLL
jgi:hypothetical protein